MINNNSNVFNIKDVKYEGVYLPDIFKGMRSNILTYNGKNYYYKYVWNDETIINELIGCYLAKYIDLESVEYKIGIINGKIYLLSEIFFDENFDYYYPEKISYIDNNNKNVYINNIPEEFPYVREKLLKLIALDIKMGQYDRVSNSNLMIKKSKVSNYTDLAPIYDYGLSYPSDIQEESLLIYSNPYISIKKNKESFKSLIKDYPQIRNYFNILSNINILNTINDIEEKNNITVNNFLKKYYTKKDKEYNKILKKI